jgi:hypothetical protein
VADHNSKMSLAIHWSLYLEVWQNMGKTKFIIQPIIADCKLLSGAYLGWHNRGITTFRDFAKHLYKYDVNCNTLW